jgi:hypothetical protein
MRQEQGILFIRTAFLGDVILMTPLLKRVRILFLNHPIYMEIQSNVVIQASQSLIYTQNQEH